MSQPFSSPKTVVFDLGGVLIDWNPRYLYRSLLRDEAAMEAFLGTVCTSTWNERQDAGRTIAEAETELIAQYPDQADLIRAYYHEFDRMLAGAIGGSVAILEELDGRGVPLYALSNWSAETFHHAEKRFAFLARFRGIIVSGRIGVMKPDARIFRHLTDKYGVDPGDCVFVDDSIKNVEGARAAGLHGLHFRTPETLRDDLRIFGLL